NVDDILRVNYANGTSMFALSNANSLVTVTGSQTVSANMSVSGTLTAGSVGSHLLPATTQTYDLGSETLEWNNLYVANNPVVGSDRRIKERIAEDVVGLPFVERLRPVTYHLTAQPKQRHIGFIAQEV